MTTSSNALPPLRITSYVDFCEVIPLMLGFRPQDSLVMVLIGAGTMQLAARFDLPQTAEAAMAVTTQGAELAERHAVDEIVLIGYTDEPRLLWGLLDQVVTGLSPIDTHVLVTDHERFWTAPDDPGSVLPDSELARHEGFVGRRLLASREDLAATVAGPDRIGQPTVEAMAHAEQFAGHLTVPEQLALLLEVAAEHIRGADDLPLESGIFLATLVEDPFVREHARLLISRRNAEHHRKLWQKVVDDAPDEIAVGPLCLLATAAWLCGHGALMQVCLERAATLAPDDETVLYLTMLADAAVDPRTWREWPDVHESWRSDAVS